MIKYALAILLFSNSIAFAALKPDDEAMATMICRTDSFISELANAHVTKGIDAARQMVRDNRARFDDECMTAPMPFEVIVLEVVKDVRGPGGHVKIWKATDPTRTATGYAVEIFEDAGA